MKRFVRAALVATVILGGFLMIARIDAVMTGRTISGQVGAVYLEGRK